MRILVFLILALVQINANAQNDLMSELQQSKSPSTQYALQTFKGTRIINGQSVETKGKGELEFIFSHRFGRINSGSYNFWGLDDAFVRLGLEYGITDRLGVSIGRTSIDKTFDTFVRYKVLRQSSGVRNVPVSITTIATGFIKTSPKASDNPGITTSNRLAYSLSALIARKMSSAVSLQVNPIFVHRNAVLQSIENNDDAAIGFGGRCKITRSLALSGEYFYRLNPKETGVTYDPIGIGLDIETGGHVFQLVFTNGLGMFDRALIAETGGDFFDGDIHFGFNITRTFQLKHSK